MLGLGILTAGAVLLWAAVTGKADAVLAALNIDKSGRFDPTLPSTSLSSNNQLVGHYTVNLPGGGSVTTNASDPAAAVENVKQQTGMVGTVRG